MLRALSGYLTEPVMGFLAIAALSLGVAPMLVAMPPRLAHAVSIAEWAIIAAFALEYLVHLALARDRRRFVRNPWRILDLFIILAPVVSLLPFAPEAFRSSPALRVLRLARAILFGARARHGLVKDDLENNNSQTSAPLRVSILSPGDAEPRETSWPELLRWARQPGEQWIHAENLDAPRVNQIASLLGLPRAMLDAALRETSYPRLESSKDWSAFAVSLPGTEKTPRTPLLLLVSERHLLSLSLHDARVQDRPGFESLPWGTRCALDIIRDVLDRNEVLVARMEDELRGLEGLAADESPETFFAAVFRLKRTIALAKGDLWRLRGLLGMLADGRRELPGLGAERDCLRELSEQADYLHETVEKAQEQLLTLLDLHLNIASYDVNRFMRLLAVVSSLALIPTIIGGLLGMNILGNPWPVTLSQVAFGTLILMLCVLYAFLAKGWLR